MADTGPDFSNSAMIALLPADPNALAVTGGDPPDELHLTLAFLGDQVADWSPAQIQALKDAVAKLAQPTVSADTDRRYYPPSGPADGLIWGHAVFNPDGGLTGEMDPAIVYLVKDMPLPGDPGGRGPSSDPLPPGEVPHQSIDMLAMDARWAAQHILGDVLMPRQYFPFVAHLTVGWGPQGLTADSLDYAGPVVFDRIRLAIGEEHFDYPLVALQPPENNEAAELEPDSPRVVIAIKELEAAGIEVKRDISANKRDALRKSGHTLGKDSTSYPIENIKDLRNAISAFGRSKPEDRAKLARHILTEAKRLKAENMVPDSIRNRAGGDAGKKEKKADEPAPETAEAVTPAEGAPERKYQSPDPRARRLAKYWARDPKGRAKWNPGTPGDFKRLLVALRAEIGPDMSERVLKGLAANIHKMATGEWPGKNAHGGKAKSAAKKVIKAGTKSTVDEWTDLEAKLDSFTALADGGISTEDAFMYGEDSEINWNITSDGTLVDDAGEPDDTGLNGEPGADEEPGADAGTNSDAGGELFGAEFDEEVTSGDPPRKEKTGA